MDEELLAEATLQSQDEINRYNGFETLGGLETELKRLKSRVVCPLLYPCFFQNNLIRPVSGVLLYGESGTGKTTIAKACSPVLWRNQSEHIDENILKPRILLANISA